MLAQADNGAGAALGILFVIYAGIAVVSIVAWVKILNKAGYSGWWILIALVPLVNLVMFLVFAFSDWPIHQEVRRLRSMPASGSVLPGSRPPVPPPPWQ